MSETSATNPSHLMMALNSESGDVGTTFYAAYMLEVNDEIRSRIEAAYALVCEHPWLHSVSIECSGSCVPGGDSDIKPNDDDQERLNDLVEALCDEGARTARIDEVALFKRNAAPGANGERVVVSRYVDPSLHLHEKWGLENFAAYGLAELAPAALKAEREALRIRSAA